MRPLKKAVAFLPNDANGIAEDQTTAAAGSLDLDGALASGGVATLPQTISNIGMKVSIEGSGDNSGINFTVTGADADGKTQAETMVGINNGTATTGLYFSTVTDIAADGAITGNVEAGWLRTNGCVSSSAYLNWRHASVGINAKLVTLEQVTVTSGADDSAVKFVITGQDVDGSAVIEVVNGSNAGTVRTTKFYAKVTEIDTIGNAGSVTAGTDSDPNGIAQAQDPAANAALTLNGALASVGVATLQAAMTYTIDHTSDDIQNEAAVWRATDDLLSLTVDADGNLAFPARALRMRVTSYTNGRGVLTVNQEAN